MTHTQEQHNISQGVLACDVGLKRIGLAHIVQGIILPLPAIVRRNRDQAASELAELIESKAIHTLVVGVPSGGVAGHLQTRTRIEHFISLVRTQAKIVYINEDYTSLEALESLCHTGQKAKRSYAKDGTLDSLAACEILARFMRV